MTFSLVARSADGSSWGVAVASKFLAVGAAVPAARAGVGAIATQAMANLSYRSRGLDLLAQGRSAIREMAQQILAIAQGQVADDRAVAVSLGRAAGVDHHLGADVVRSDRQGGRALRPHHRRAFGAHLVELGQPALVAPPPPGDAALQPMLLQLQLGVEPLGLARHHDEQLVA